MWRELRKQEILSIESLKKLRILSTISTILYVKSIHCHVLVDYCWLKESYIVRDLID